MVAGITKWFLVTIKGYLSYTLPKFEYTFVKEGVVRGRVTSVLLAVLPRLVMATWVPQVFSLCCFSYLTE